MSLPLKVNLPLYRGDDEPYVATILDDDGAAMNLTGCALKLTVKEARGGAPTGDPIVTLTWSQSGPTSGITVSDPTAGVAEIVFSHSQTATLQPGRAYLYDLQVTDAGGVVTTMVRGGVTVAADVSA